MCCTFGDTADVEWWRTYKLPLVEAINREGRMTKATGLLHGLTTHEARSKIAPILQEERLLIDQQPISQTNRRPSNRSADTPT